VLLITTAYPIYDEFWTMAQGGRRTLRRGSSTHVQLTGFKIPAEPDTLVALLNACTVEEIKRICRRSAWMAKQPYSYFTRYLPELAKQFLKAKRAPRYPKSDRPSSIPRKFWFLACALAGAMYGLSARRAINIVGPGKPEEIFESLLPAKVILSKLPRRPGSGQRKELAKH